MSSPKLLFLSGSIRADSLNAKLADAAYEVARLNGIDATRLSLADYAMPIYDGDLEDREGVPDAAKRLNTQFLDHHGIFIAAPEYNAGITPLLKNTIDWLSRIDGAAGLKSSAYALAAASPSPLGGIRGLIQLRQTLAVGIGVDVIGSQLLVPGGASAFGDNGMLAEEGRAAFLKTQIQTLARHAVQLHSDAS